MAVAAAVETSPIGEINTTPLIDVMLVLLIMFIITIPIQTHSVQIGLPTPTEIIVDRERNKVAIDQAGAIFWNGREVSSAELAGLLNRVAALREQPELQVEPHSDARYATVGEVIAAIKQAGVTAMGLVGNERYAAF